MYLHQVPDDDSGNSERSKSWWTTRRLYSLLTSL